MSDSYKYECPFCGETKTVPERPSLGCLRWACGTKGGPSKDDSLQQGAECRRRCEGRTAMTFTAERIAEIRARCEAATEGPWERWVKHAEVFAGPLQCNIAVRAQGGRGRLCEFDPDNYDQHGEAGAIVQSRADAEFAAKARVDLPDALDEIERLQAVVENAYREGWGARERRGEDVLGEATFDSDWRDSEAAAAAKETP